MLMLVMRRRTERSVFTKHSQSKMKLTGAKAGNLKTIWLVAIAKGWPVFSPRKLTGVADSNFAPAGRVRVNWPL